MKFSYKFSNLLGTVYRQGNLLFTFDGNSIISPVGNKITVYDLKNHKSRTLPIESRFNFTTLALSPNGNVLIAANSNGEIHLISLIGRIILYTLRTNRNIKQIAFSPNGKYFAFTKETNVFIYKVPVSTNREFKPFTMERIFRGAFDETTSVSWSTCSRFIAVGSKDATTRIYTLDKCRNISSVICLGGHKESIVNAFFEYDSLICYTLSRNGHLAVWENSIDLNEITMTKDIPKKMSDSEDDVSKEPVYYESEEGEKNKKLYYKRKARYFLRDSLPEEMKKGQNELTSADYHCITRMMVTGYSSGIFFIHEMPNALMIHSLSISDQEICSVNFNKSGDWIAFGCSKHGQLLVWEWQSETYILQQQGHFNDMAILSYAPDGEFIATGGEDGKIKLWSSSSGFCFVTFKEHTAAITGIVVSSDGKVIISSSIDGTVRAFDTTRYRNFRTFTSPRPAQFSCVSADVSCELIAAGGQDTFEIYLWSVKTGRLLEVIPGHQGPISQVVFSPSTTSNTLVTVSWDGTLRIWDALAVNSHNEEIQLGSDGLGAAFRPDGHEVAVATLKGHILFFETRDGTQTGCIEGRNDLGSGRADSDLITAKKSIACNGFTSLCYTTDGSCILAGGNSKYICIYHVRGMLLIKKIELTQNRSFDAMDDVINKRKLCEFGNLALVEDRDDPDGTGATVNLPGSRRRDMSSRAYRPEVMVSSLQFSPTGREFAAATTEGLLIYSLDTEIMFSPTELEEDITPAAVLHTLKRGNEIGKALLMALKLNETQLIRQTVESVRYMLEDIQLIVLNIPELFVVKLLAFLAVEIETSPHTHFYAIWCYKTLTTHGVWIKRQSKELKSVLNLMHKNLVKKLQDVSDICEHNEYMIKFLISISKMDHHKNLNSLPIDMDPDKNDDPSQDDECLFFSKWNDSEEDDL